MYAVGAAVPVTRPAFHDVRYHLHLGAALLTAFIVVPLGAVLLKLYGLLSPAGDKITRTRRCRRPLSLRPRPSER